MDVYSYPHPFPQEAGDPFGGGTSSPAPVVTVSAPSGTDSSGDPDLIVSWSSVVPWGLTPTTWRVRVHNAGDTVTYVDTGVRAGADVSYTILDAGEDLPQSDTLTCEVSVGVGPVAYATLGTGTSTFSLDWGTPVIAYTGSQFETDAFIDVNWSYTDTAPQDEYRIEVRNSADLIVWASGWVESSSTSVTVPVSLPSGSYTVASQVKNSAGVESAEITTGWTIELAEALASSASVSELVGTVAEVALQGQPLMLFDNRDARQDWKYQRRIMPLDAPRFSSSDTPFSQSFDKYTFTGHGLWDGGAGQSWGDRKGADDSAFQSSWGIDPFSEHGEFSLINGTDKSTIGDLRRVAVTDTMIAAQSGASDIETSTDGTVWTSNPIGATAYDLTSDGVEYWYAACAGSGIWRGTAGSPGASFPTAITPEAIGWAADRLIVAYPDTSATPNEVATLTDTGATETVLNTFAAGTTVSEFTPGPGFVWFIVNRGTSSAIYAWTAGSSDPAVQVAELPAGETAVELYHYQQQVFIRTENENGQTIWRAPYSDSTGRLSLEIAVDLPGQSACGFAGVGGILYFGWSQAGAADESGTGAYNLATGGWCHHIYHTDTGDVRGVEFWRGDLWFFGTAGGYRENSTPVDSGWLLTSMWDGGGSNLSKIWDSVSVSMGSLPPSASAQVQVTYDRGLSFTDAGTLTDAGVSSFEWTLNGSAKSMAVKVTLTPGGVNSPAIHVVQGKMHPQQVTDTMLQLPVACFDSVLGLNRKPLPGQSGSQGSGAALARTLESWVGQLVLVQDVDWQPGEAGVVYELVAAEADKVSLYSDRKGGQQVGLVVMLALRKPN